MRSGLSLAEVSSQTFPPQPPIFFSDGMALISSMISGKPHLLCRPYYR